HALTGATGFFGDHPGPRGPKPRTRKESRDRGSGPAREPRAASADGSRRLLARGWSGTPPGGNGGIGRLAPGAGPPNPRGRSGWTGRQPWCPHFTTAFLSRGIGCGGSLAVGRRPDGRAPGSFGGDGLGRLYGTASP